MRDWKNFIREYLPENVYWFAYISPETGFLDPDNKKAGKHRDHRARKDFEQWVSRVGLPYYSPHKFRHGFGVYALKIAIGLGDFKAISKNMMHVNLSITDGIYGMFSQEEVKNRITNLSNAVSNRNFTNDDFEVLADLISKKFEKKIKKREL